MVSALIGHTGFVGGNLARRHRFDERYRSTDIEAIAGRRFDLLVCAGAPAAKWVANADPDADRRNLERLWGAARSADADRVVLISTVDVFGRPVGLDEFDPPDPKEATPYGRHRLELEYRFAAHFDATILRLPGLFGDGLKKNAIYDFLHEHETHKIDHRASYQFYGLDRLWDDIRAAMDRRLPLVHLATEPVTIGEVAREGFGLDFRNELDRPPARYDFRTGHAGAFGGEGPYVQSKRQVLDQIARFVARHRGVKRCA